MGPACSRRASRRHDGALDTAYRNDRGVEGSKSCSRFKVLLCVDAMCDMFSFTDGCSAELTRFSWPSARLSTPASCLFLCVLLVSLSNTPRKQGMHPNMNRHPHQQGYGNSGDAQTVWRHDLWSEEWQPIAVGDDESSWSLSYGYGLHASLPTGETRGGAVSFVYSIA